MRIEAANEKLDNRIVLIADRRPKLAQKILVERRPRTYEFERIVVTVIADRSSVPQIAVLIPSGDLISPVVRRLGIPFTSGAKTTTQVCAAPLTLDDLLDLQRRIFREFP